MGSIPVCPVLIDGHQPCSLVGSKCWPPHQVPQNTPSNNGCNTLAVHEVHEVKEEEPASTEVMRGSQWVKWLPQPLLVEHKGQVRERKQKKKKRKIIERNEQSRRRKTKEKNKAMFSVGLQAATSLRSVNGLKQITINNNKKLIKSVNPIKTKLEMKNNMNKHIGPSSLVSIAETLWTWFICAP